MYDYFISIFIRMEPETKIIGYRLVNKYFVCVKETSCSLTVTRGLILLIVIDTCFFNNAYNLGPLRFLATLACRLIFTETLWTRNLDDLIQRIGCEHILDTRVCLSD